MAESTIVKTNKDGVLTFAALGGGAYSPTTGAIIGAALEYTVAFEAGDVQIDLPSRSVSNFKDRGRITNPPSIRYGDDEEGSLSFTAYLRDLSDAAAATLADILASLAGNPSGLVGSSWESTRASAPGAGDAEVFSLAVKLTLTNAGDATDKHAMAFNYVTGSGSIADGDPSTLSLNLTIHDGPTDYYIGDAP